MSKETDYLVKMYEKYCPTKEVEGITCFTKEGMEWFDSIIKLKRASETLDIIKSNCEFDFLEEKINDMPIRYEIHIRPKNKEQLLFTCLAIYPKTKEEFYLLKEVLI